MEFCPKCENMMISERKDGRLRSKCRGCGYTPRLKRVVSTHISEKIKDGIERISVFDQDENLKQYPVDKGVMCPECGNNGAYWYMQQTRGADEPQTTFYCCTKCKHKWREY